MRSIIEANETIHLARMVGMLLNKLASNSRKGLSDMVRLLLNILQVSLGCLALGVDDESCETANADVPEVTTLVSEVLLILVLTEKCDHGFESVGATVRESELLLEKCRHLECLK